LAPTNTRNESNYTLGSTLWGLLGSSGFVWNSPHFARSEIMETLIGSPLSSRLCIEEASEVRASLIVGKCHVLGSIDLE
jgi:hypothetical protein